MNTKLQRTINTTYSIRETENKPSTILAVIPYNVPSVPILQEGGFIEVITENAFVRTLQEQDVLALYNHDENKVMGNTKSGTLKLESREDGLYVELQIGDTTFSKDAYDIIKRGDCTTLSFGFFPVTVDIGDDGVHYLKDVDLFEISFCVPNPAYLETESMARAIKENPNIHKERKIIMKKGLNIKRSIDAEAIQKAIDENDYEYIKALIAELTALLPKEETTSEETREGDIPEEVVEQVIDELEKELIEEETV